MSKHIRKGDTFKTPMVTEAHDASPDIQEVVEAVTAAPTAITRGTGTFGRKMRNIMAGIAALSGVAMAACGGTNTDKATSQTVSATKLDNGGHGSQAQALTGGSGVRKLGTRCYLPHYEPSTQDIYCSTVNGKIMRQNIKGDVLTGQVSAPTTVATPSTNTPPFNLANDKTWYAPKNNTVGNIDNLFLQSGGYLFADKGTGKKPEFKYRDAQPTKGPDLAHIVGNTLWLGSEPGAKHVITSIDLKTAPTNGVWTANAKPLTKLPPVKDLNMIYWDDKNETQGWATTTQGTALWVDRSTGSWTVKTGGKYNIPTGKHVGFSISNDADRCIVVGATKFNGSQYPELWIAKKPNCPAKPGEPTKETTPEKTPDEVAADTVMDGGTGDTTPDGGTADNTPDTTKDGGTADTTADAGPGDTTPDTTKDAGPADNTPDTTKDGGTTDNAPDTTPQDTVKKDGQTTDTVKKGEILTTKEFECDEKGAGTLKAIDGQQAPTVKCAKSVITVTAHTKKPAQFMWKKQGGTIWSKITLTQDSEGCGKSGFMFNANSTICGKQKTDTNNQKFLTVHGTVNKLNGKIIRNGVVTGHYGTTIEHDVQPGGQQIKQHTSSGQTYHEYHEYYKGKQRTVALGTLGKGGSPQAIRNLDRIKRQARNAWDSKLSEIPSGEPVTPTPDVGPQGPGCNVMGGSNENQPGDPSIPLAFAFIVGDAIRRKILAKMKKETADKK